MSLLIGRRVCSGELTFLAVEKHIRRETSLVNWDQTPLKYVPYAQSTMVPRNSTSVTITGSLDKRCITSTFAITMTGQFLSLQLIYGGKILQSLPRYKFLSGFSLSANPAHYSNTQESLKYIVDVIAPHMERQRVSEGLAQDQKGLVIINGN